MPFPRHRWLLAFTQALDRCTPQQVGEVGRDLASYAPELIPLLAERTLQGAAQLSPGKDRLLVLEWLCFHQGEPPVQRWDSAIRTLVLPCLPTNDRDSNDLARSLLFDFGRPQDLSQLVPPKTLLQIGMVVGCFAKWGYDREAKSLVEEFRQRTPLDKHCQELLDLSFLIYDRPLSRWVAHKAWRSRLPSTSFETLASLSWCADSIGDHTLARQALEAALLVPSSEVKGWSILGMVVGRMGLMSVFLRAQPGAGATEFYGNIVQGTRHRTLLLDAAARLLSPKVLSKTKPGPAFKVVWQTINSWVNRDPRVAEQLYVLLERVAPPEECASALPYHQQWRLRNDPGAQLREILRFPTDYRRLDSLAKLVRACLQEGLVGAALKIQRLLRGHDSLSAQLQLSEQLRAQGYTQEAVKILEHWRALPIIRVTPELFESDEDPFQDQVYLAETLARNKLPEGRPRLFDLAADVKRFAEWLAKKQISQDDISSACQWRLEDILSAFESADLWEEAFEIGRQMPDVAAAAVAIGKLGHPKFFPGMG
ncbi:hypothetical protein [Armatimonas sp.]|uniref:hypothetical protein n=1 Tax=Armatimonas sp. TaxID=1872638 RepID=UPI00286C9A02|nr:hypothetical protein [Armatimonas sp.]